MPFIQLSTFDTKPNTSIDKETLKAETLQMQSTIAELQNKLYASKKNSILVIFQGMDASGKDGAVKNVFGNINPMGIKVFGFKKPTEEEFGHDFLWRIHKVCPEKGMIHIFNRSHYEDILIQRVHKWIDDKTVNNRIDAINDFEKLLTKNGTVLLKFYLHISKEEQLERLEERKTNPEKMWKYNAADMVEREHWDEYMVAYEDALDKCSKYAEWNIIPSDKNWYKEYLITKKLHDTLMALNLEYPALKTE